MRNLIIVILLSIKSISNAQTGDYPKIETIEITDRILHGYIDEYPITIYLKFHQFSRHSSASYSVEGWYYYDRIKTKIPLVGVYDYNGLVLFHFDEDAKSKNLLVFSEDKNNHWEEMEYYMNLEGFREKFALNDEECSWTNPVKTLKVTIENDGFSVLENKDFLMFSPYNGFDLKNVGVKDWDLTIRSQKDGRYLIEYMFPSNPRANGRCGAGEEKGFLYVEFDENRILKNYVNHIYESCLFSVESEEIQAHAMNRVIYRCTNFMNVQSYNLAVDFGQATIEKLEE